MLKYFASLSTDKVTLFKDSCIKKYSDTRIAFREMHLCIKIVSNSFIMIFHCKSFFFAPLGLIEILFKRNLAFMEIIVNYYSTLIHKNISKNGLNVKRALFRYNFEKNNKKQIRFLVLCAPTTAIYDYILCFGRVSPIGAMVTFVLT